MEDIIYRDKLSVSGLLKVGKENIGLNFPKVPGYYGYGRVPVRDVKPFYMLAARPVDEKGLLQDLDYLKRMYPEIVREYMEQIAETLDTLDYEGSMLYDAYPDTEHLKRLSRTIVDIIRQKEEGKTRPYAPKGMMQAVPYQTVPPLENIPIPAEGESVMSDMLPEEMVGSAPTEDKWTWIEYLVRILLSLEVYKRRNRKSRYY